jgi:hypothetical protein
MSVTTPRHRSASERASASADAAASPAAIAAAAAAVTAIRSASDAASSPPSRATSALDASCSTPSAASCARASPSWRCSPPQRTLSETTSSVEDASDASNEAMRTSAASRRDEVWCCRCRIAAKAPPARRGAASAMAAAVNGTGSWEASLAAEFDGSVSRWGVVRVRNRRIYYKYQVKK